LRISVSVILESSSSSSSSAEDGGGLPGCKRVEVEKAIGERFACTSHRETAEDDDDEGI
jgi:hypothetical protein